MGGKITQQDIADALMLSRNTVSKALNNDSELGEKTRELVIKTAIDMGYKKFSDYASSVKSDSQNKIISLITSQEQIGNTFWAPFVRGVEDAVSNAGYNLFINIINNVEEDNCLLPKNFDTQKPAGIIMNGIFLKQYYLKIKSTGIPFVSLDTVADVDFQNLIADTVMMENESCVYDITSYLIKNGHKEIGFVGDIGACRSFLERWIGFKHAMEDNNLKIDERLCITNSLPRHLYRYEELSEIISKFEKYPTALVIANDTIAIDVFKVLRELGIKIPEDIAISGFDDIQEATVITPSLTTVKCYKEELGKRSGEELIWRIKNPDRAYEFVRISTKVIFRDSTEKFLPLLNA